MISCQVSGSSTHTTGPISLKLGSTVGLGESRRVEGSENTLQNKCISKKKKKVKVESEKVGLRLNIQKTKIMASGPYSQGQAKVKTRSNV